MRLEEIFLTPQAREFLKRIEKATEKTHRPPDEVILDEVDLCNTLKISKRHAADLRREGLIRYAKSGGKLYYKLSWVLEFIDRNTVLPPQNKFTAKT